MQLRYEDFQSEYENIEGGEDWKREHFNMLVNIIECFVRQFWGDDPILEAMGISISNIPETSPNMVESKTYLTTPFNHSADKAGKKGP